MKKRIVLIGMMGCGKTTIGRHLSNILELDLIDSDKLIEKDCNKKISTIFKDYGEEYFRKKEEKVILNTIKKNKNSYVLALGGGSFLNKKIQKIILDNTISFWLNTNLNLIYKRCKKSKNRPLLNKDNNNDLNKTIRNLSKIRNPEYSKANFKIDANESPEKICKKILLKIKDIN